MPDHRPRPWDRTSDGPAEPADDVTAGDVMAGERRIARADTALPDWYASDTFYRPIPIVWFAAALLLQAILQWGTVFLLHGFIGMPVGITLSISVFLSFAVWCWTRARGMAQAPAGWRAATMGMVLMFQALVALTLLA